MYKILLFVRQNMAMVRIFEFISEKLTEHKFFMVFLPNITIQQQKQKQQKKNNTQWQFDIDNL